MKKSVLDPELSNKLAALYGRMEHIYDQVAEQLEFSCTGCPDNCCDSFFLHHTYIEWAYLWEGLNKLSEERVEELVARAVEYVKESEKMLAKGERPNQMCPLNEDGLCALYENRLMICRMHGVPSSLTRPDGKKMHFPGCFRCQEIVGEQKDVPTVDRTELYRELVELESILLGHKRQIMPRVKMTIAQMMVQGPPQLP